MNKQTTSKLEIRNIAVDHYFKMLEAINNAEKAEADGKQGKAEAIEKYGDRLGPVNWGTYSLSKDLKGDHNFYINKANMYANAVVAGCIMLKSDI